MQGLEAISARQMGWGPVLLTAVGVGIVLLGAHSFYVQGHFGFVDALYCGLLLLPAAGLLLVTSYTLQHARLAVVMPLLFGGLLIYAYPSFAVALGLALVGAIVSPVLRDLNDARRQRISTPELHG